MTLSKDKKKELVRIANEARKWAYVPYSKYAVGAALLTKSGRVYDGVNVENAAYPVTICAERTAVFKAVSNGEREFLAIAVVTRNGGMPCGSCRQVMVEFSPEMSVIVADETGDIKSELKLSDLLPGAFRSDSLT
jgi:cytidine deaminase